MKQVVIYGRCSTDKQTVSNQLNDLREVANRSGWEVIDQYLDEGISGSKGRDKRPEFDRLLKDDNRKKFDGILVWIKSFSFFFLILLVLKYFLTCLEINEHIHSIDFLESSLPGMG